MRWIGWMWMVSMLLSSAAGAAEPLARCPRLAGSEESALVLRCAPGQAPLIESGTASFVPKGLLPWPAGFSAVGFRVHPFELEGRSFTVVEVESQSGGVPALSLTSACVLDDGGRDTGVGFPLAFDNPCGQSYRAAWSVRPLAGDGIALCVTSIDWPREKAAWGDRGTTGTWPICGDLTVGEHWYRLDAKGALVSMNTSTYRILAGLRPAVAPPSPGRDAALHRSLAALSTSEREELDRSLLQWRAAMVKEWSAGPHKMKDLRALRSMSILAYGIEGNQPANRTEPSAEVGETELQPNAAITGEDTVTDRASRDKPRMASASLAKRGTAP